MKKDSTHLSNLSNFDTFRIPFYYNYEDYFPALNDSILDEYGLWDDLYTNNGPNNFNHHSNSNENSSDDFSSLHPLFSILSNITVTANSSISLSDIIISHHLNSIISTQNKSNYMEEVRRLPELRLPPWDNLTNLKILAFLIIFLARILDLFSFGLGQNQKLWSKAEH